MSRRNRKIRGGDAGGWMGYCRDRGRVRAWLRETGSLTARLQQSGPTALQLLYQGRRRLLRDELRMLCLTSGRDVPVREVLLRVQGRVAVYAHTVANRAALNLLRRAGQRPLATVLFADPRVHAGPLCYRQLDARHTLHRAAVAWCENPAARRLPARRALFACGAARLLVTEVFLPWEPDLA